MSIKIDNETWVWVVILNPEKGEQILGQQYKDSDISFIPTFMEKDQALVCLHHFTIEKGVKYEAQAILYEDLVRYAAENGFLIFVLNGEGEVLDKIQPEVK